MTLRLTLLFAASALSILLLVSLLLHWRLASTLLSEDKTILRENMAALRATWSESPELRLTLLDHVVLEAEGSREEPYYVRVLSGGSVAFETPGMADVLSHEVFSAEAAIDDDPVVWRSSDGRIYLLHEAGVEGASRTRFQTALDVTHDAELLARYRGDLIAVVFAGTLLAALAGFLTARRGLLPLERMRTYVQRITAGRLDQRIGGHGWPAELADLASGFDEMLRRLEDSFVRLSRFSADLAHELRTPLTVLRNEAEVALSQERAPREYQRVLESSLEELDRLTTLVDRLLFLARVDAGAAPLELATLDAATEVDAVCEFYAQLAEEKGVELTRKGAGTVVADSILLRRAIANLVANAVEHTPSGGQIQVAIEPQREGVAIQVSDTGSGIDAAHLPHVFERFFQVDPARERRTAGAGLGLSLVHSIMQLHRGTVGIRSTPGEGTHATLLFPLRPASGSDPALPAASPVSGDIMTAA